MSQTTTNIRPAQSFLVKPGVSCEGCQEPLATLGYVYRASRKDSWRLLCRECLKAARGVDIEEPVVEQKRGGKKGEGKA